MNEPASEPPQCATKSISPTLPAKHPPTRQTFALQYVFAFSGLVAVDCAILHEYESDARDGQLVAALMASNSSRTFASSSSATMAQHGFKQLRKYRLESLAADPIRRFPDHNQRLFDRFAIDSSRARRRSVSARCVPCSEVARHAFGGAQ